MTRTGLVLITSLLALFSPAAVNDAAAYRDCRSEQMACNSRCTTMIPSYGQVERAVQQGCIESCRNAEWSCARENSLESDRAEKPRWEERHRQSVPRGQW
jgi:hypothetical protein